MASKPKTSLQAALAEIEKKHGSGSVFTLGDISMITERVPSGNLSLDLALGGGWSKGSVCELYGASGGGKTALAMSLISQAQQADGECAFLDVEGGLNQEFAARCGVDIDRLHVELPYYGEQVFESAEIMVESGAFAVIVVDSIAAMAPLSEISGDFTDQHIGGQARMMGHGLRKLNATMNKTRSKTIVMFINQIRGLINGGGPFAPKTTTSGGRATPFFASTRCEVSRIGAVKRGTGTTAEILGHEVRVKIKKNRADRPDAEAFFDILYGTGPDAGISNASSIVKLGKKLGIMAADKQGWHTNTLTGEKLAHGYLATISYLNEHPEEASALTAAITEAYDPSVAPAEDDE